jgi:hypothetical protein
MANDRLSGLEFVNSRDSISEISTKSLNEASFNKNAVNFQKEIPE